MAIRGNIGTIPTFDSRKADWATLHLDGTTSTGKYMGQVRDMEWQFQRGKEEIQRVSDDTIFRSYPSAKVTFSFKVYEQDTLEEIMKALGEDLPTAGGWSSASVALDSDTPATMSTVTIAGWAGKATTSALQWTETITNWDLEVVRRPIAAGGTTIWEFSGEADTVTVAPENGVGA